MPSPSPLGEIETALQELRVEQHRTAFTHKLGAIVSALGTIPDRPPAGFAASDMVRLRELAEETIDAIERRIDSGGDNLKTQQQLAGTVYEIRKRMEEVEIWFRHRETGN